MRIEPLCIAMHHSIVPSLLAASPLSIHWIGPYTVIADAASWLARCYPSTG